MKTRPRAIRAFIFCIILLSGCNIVFKDATPEPPVEEVAIAPVFPSVTPIPTDSIIPTSSPEEITPLLPNTDITTLLDQISSQEILSHIETLSSIPSRHVNSTDIYEAGDYIESEFQRAGGNLQVERQPFPLNYNGVSTTQYNIIATLPGDDPSTGVVIIGAHYDSRTFDLTDTVTNAPGANDNASGVAVLIELAQLLSKTTPKHTIMFVAFSAEEVGAWGSKHLLSTLQEEGISISAMIVLDIIGNSVGPQGEGAIRVFSAPPNTSPSRRLARYTAVLGDLYQPDFAVQVQSTVDRPGRYSDHIPFSDAGFPALRFIELVEDTNHQHSSQDRIDYLSPSYLEHSARLACVALVNLGNVPSPPTDLVLSDTILTWRGNDSAGGYLIGVRSEDDLTYSNVIQIGPDTAFDLRNIDASINWIGIASISEDGFISQFSEEIAVP